jgi:ABC-type Fe3+-hydroxamate transport system substrate-binding protein
MRVVSLVPSATETLLRWGIEPVACTRFCEQPGIRHVGGTKDPHIDEIVGLAPDLVVICDQENRRDDATALEAAGISIHVIHLLHVNDNTPQMQQLAAALHIEPPQHHVATEPVPIKLRAYIPIWKRPWMTINHQTYASTLLATLGVHNVAADLTARYPELDLDTVRSLEPDVVLAPTEPYPFAERHRAVLETVAPVSFVDGQDLFWWGARALEAQQRLACVVADLLL